MKASIKITSLNKDITVSANDTTNKMTVNGKNIKYNVAEFIGKLAIITSNWAPFYGNNSIIDGEKFIVEITGKTTRRFVGLNAFPSNYDKFAKLIQGVLSQCN